MPNHPTCCRLCIHFYSSFSDDNHPCTTCGTIEILTDDELSQPVTQTRGTDANGCDTVTLSCNGPTGTSDTIFRWFENGVDRGVSTDGPNTGSVSRTLTCNAQGQLVLTENGVSGVVTQVECLAA
ncbi:hypothetical protein AAVH_04123 [Aphelenchoides avenae]|nr:hypothetical protein AAVH_04123 [Aphelenchus avenae]